MSQIVLSLSSDNKAIDEYTNPSSFSGSSGSSSEGNTTDKYEFGVPGLPLEVVQEGLRTRSESRSKASMSAPSSTNKDEVEVVYSYAIGVVSKMDDRKLDLLKEWYQIPDELNLRLASVESGAVSLILG